MTQKTLYLALYKGNREGWGIASIKARFGDWITRKITRGIYSHCEIAYPLPSGGHGHRRRLAVFAKRLGGVGEIRGVLVRRGQENG